MVEAGTGIGKSFGYLVPLIDTRKIESAIDRIEADGRDRPAPAPERDEERADRIRRDFARSTRVDEAQLRDAADVRRLLAFRDRLNPREADFAASLERDIIGSEDRLSAGRRKWLDDLMRREPSNVEGS